MERGERKGVTGEARAASGSCTRECLKQGEEGKAEGRDIREARCGASASLTVIRA